MEARRSQSTASRRRRLLTSQDSDDLLAEFEALTPQTQTAEPLNVTITAPDRHILQRMISGHLWKHAVLIATVTIIAALAIWSENLEMASLQELAATSQPRISKGLAGALLLVSGQLCLMIGWIRSRSSVDYNGRYRCWKWLSGLLVLTGGLWITNVQDSLPQVAQLFAEPVIGFIGAARRTIVVVPLAAVSLWILSRVIPDMGRNRWSQAVFSIGVMAAVARLVLSYSPDFTAIPPTALDGLLLSASVLMMCSLLLHTRFVLYISKDPPERTVSTKRRERQVDAVKDESECSESASDGTDDGAHKSAGTKKKAAAKRPAAAEEPESPDVIPVESPEATQAAASEPKDRKRRRNKRRSRKAA